jgi:WD40 repeat protein
LIDAPDGGFTFGVWDSESGERIYTDPVRDDGRASVMAFSSDGSRLFVSYGQDLAHVNVGDLMRVFDTTTWEYTEVQEERIGGRWVTPDGRSLIGHHGNTIRVTDTETFETRTLVSEATEGGIKDLAISDDGSLVASAATDGSVRVFDLATGELRHELSVGTGLAQNVEFVDNDRHLMVTPGEGQVLIMTLDTGELLDVARARVTRGFNPAECDKYQIDPCPDLESIRDAA